MAPPAAVLEWVMLRHSTSSVDRPAEAGISLELDAPPRTTQLVVPSSHVASGSGVLAADRGFLLLSSSRGGTGPLASYNKPSYHLWHSVYNTFKLLPATPESAPPLKDNTATAGLVVIPGSFGRYRATVAELSAVDSAAGATLCCFSNDTDKWTHKTLRCPLTEFPWCSTHVVSYKWRLWWVDLLQGLLACNPFYGKPELHLVRLPSCLRLRNKQSAGNEQRLRQGLSKHRCVSLSCGKLRLVVITRHASLPRIKLWTLADHEAGRWMLDYEVPFEDIWAHQSYHDTGLPKERPVLALLHPTSPHVVYFSLEEHLFAVDLKTKMVTESASSNGRDDEESVASSCLLLAWELPSCLRRHSSGRGPPLADTMEFYKLAKIALAYLNSRKKKKTEENEFKLSERLFLQYFIDEGKDNKYAHMNFYTDNGSEKHLVFAELVSHSLDDHEPDNWTLSSCKILRRNYQGGLYGENADVRRSKVTRKRKSLYCFACEPELLHPMCGFDGGNGM